MGRGEGRDTIVSDVKRMAFKAYNSIITMRLSVCFIKRYFASVSTECYTIQKTPLLGGKKMAEENRKNIGRKTQDGSCWLRCQR